MVFKVSVWLHLECLFFKFSFPAIDLLFVSSVLGDGVVMCAASTLCVKMVLTDAVLEDSGTLHWPGEAS